MLILCLDSSDRHLRTGLYENSDVLCEITSDSMGNHSEHIINQIDSMLTQSAKVLDEVDMLAINIGPGSFTGLRIGMSAMAGISFSRGIPLAGFNGFEIISEDLKSANGKFMALIQCRGEEFYCAEFDVSDNDVGLKSRYKIVSANTLSKTASELCLVGPGAKLFLDNATDDIKHKFKMSSELNDIPTLRSLAVLTLSNPTVDEKIPDLFYLAPSQAEVNYERKKAGN